MSSKELKWVELNCVLPSNSSTRSQCQWGTRLQRALFVRLDPLLQRQSSSGFGVKAKTFSYFSYRKSLSRTPWYRTKLQLSTQLFDHPYLVDKLIDMCNQLLLMAGKVWRMYRYFQYQHDSTLHKFYDSSDKLCFVYLLVNLLLITFIVEKYFSLINFNVWIIDLILLLY